MPSAPSSEPCSWWSSFNPHQPTRLRRPRDCATARRGTAATSESQSGSRGSLRFVENRRPPGDRGVQWESRWKKSLNTESPAERKRPVFVHRKTLPSKKAMYAMSGAQIDFDMICSDQQLAVDRNNLLKHSLALSMCLPRNIPATYG